MTTSCARFAFLACLLGATHLLATPIATHLTCEQQERPLSIERTSPRLSWQIAGTERGLSQSAYQILVATSSASLARDSGDLWDSGKIVSSNSLLVSYTGVPLRSGQQCFWKVRIWDGRGKDRGWSDISRWEMGLLNEADWGASQWIQWTNETRPAWLVWRPLQTTPMPAPRQVKSFPAPYLRRSFALSSKVVRARAYVSGVGYSELYVNGKRAGDAVLDPGQTTYDVRTFYTTHDITSLLHPGSNALGVVLGNGFYGQDQAFGVTWLANGTPRLRARLVIELNDGSTREVITDTNWKAANSPIVYDNVYGGETYDARRESPGWAEPTFNESGWLAAQIATGPGGRLVAQDIPPIRCVKEFNPVKVTRSRTGGWIFDLGQNIAGWARIHPREPAGTVVKLRFAEALSADGQELDMASTGVGATGLEQTDIYVCRGGKAERWEPRFTYHGFRYVEVTGLTKRPGTDFLTGVLVRSDVPRRGSFECSDAWLNKIYQTSLITIEDNLHSTSEDCPHREKCGWLGDAHCVAETAIFNFDMGRFWAKFVDDIETVLGRGGQTYWGQKATAGIPCNIAVGRRLCQEARPDWGAAYVLLPWNLYQYYGDQEVLQHHYPHLQGWINYVESLTESNLVVRGYGDWCPPGGNTNMECPVALSSTAYHFRTLEIMSQMAALLGRGEESSRYANRAGEIRRAFNVAFQDPRTGGYGSQTADALVLAYGLMPDGQRASLARDLAREVRERHQGHGFVGIHGGRWLYTQLSEHGEAGLAIAALKQPSYPSHRRLLEIGMTTWPEQFDDLPPGQLATRRSLNHPMQSGFAAWFHESLAGIRPAAPGFRRVELKPHGYENLQWVRASHQSPVGLIRSEWRRAGEFFDWQVTVPPNSCAIIHVPARPAEQVMEGGREAASRPGIRLVRREAERAVFEIESGTYHFRSRL